MCPSVLVIIMVPSTIGDAAVRPRSSRKGKQQPDVWFTHHTAPFKCAVCCETNLVILCASLYTFDSSCQHVQKKKKTFRTIEETSHCDDDDLGQSFLTQSPHLTALVPVPLGLLAQGPPIPQTRPPQGLNTGIATDGTGRGHP